MATLAIDVAASTDDAVVTSSGGYNNTDTVILVGGLGTATTDGGQGWRFDNVTLTSADTINTAHISQMKSGSAWSSIAIRITAIDEDDTATFSSGSPPGARAIVSASIGVETPDVNRTSGTRYNIPAGSTPRATLAAAITAVIARGGWASGNAIGIVNNSEQDASYNTGFARENFHSWDSATASSEPQLVIDYTAGATAKAAPSRRLVTRQQHLLIR